MAEFKLLMQNVVCVLGHRQRAYECPACGEEATGETATLEHWRWYRDRTSSKRIKEAIDVILTARGPQASCPHFIDGEPGMRCSLPDHHEGPHEYGPVSERRDDA